MEEIHGGYTLEFCPGAFPLSTDSMALADFAKLPKNARVLDLGSGCGTLGILLCAKDPHCTVTGVEIREDAHNTALENAARNGLAARLSSICGDIRAITHSLAMGQYTTCISNPPYFSGGPETKENPAARRETLCDLQDLFSCGDRALKFGGDFFLVHRPERLGQICAVAARNHMEVKRILLLRHREDGDVSLILVHCRKGAKPGLILEEAALYHRDGTPTPYCKRIYH